MFKTHWSDIESNSYIIL